MKDSEFIELLNLYLDHEITAADAARLEAEVQNNPQRRRVYREYCQMQKACKVLAADFQTEPVAVAPRKTIDFRAAQQRQQRTSVFYTIGALTAAAACIAIVVIGRNEQAAPRATPSIAHAEPSSGRAPETAALVSVGPAAHAQPAAGVADLYRPPTSLVKAPLPFTLSEEVRASALERTTTDQAAAQFAWLQEFKLDPLHKAPGSLAGPTIEVRPGVTPVNTQSAKRPLEAEVTVIRFQK